MNEQIKQLIEQISQAVQESPETVMAAIQNGGEEGFKQVATLLQKGDVQSAKSMIQQLAGVKKALHGAKLNYIKFLKNQCPDGEELYYYKRGGSVGCGCKKKENGGEIVERAQKGTAVERFKKASTGTTIPSKKDTILPSDTVHIKNPKTGKMEVRDLSGKHKQFKKLTPQEYQRQSNTKKNDIDLKGYEKGGEVKKNRGGSKVVAKFKKHRQGGSLNGIPFYQGGTPKGGINQWTFSERPVYSGNGYEVKNHWIYQNLVNGRYQGDFPPTVAGRTIYSSPYRSDTLYWRTLDPDQSFLFEKTPTKSKDQKSAKQNFYNWVKKAKAQDDSSKQALNRAKKGK